MAYQRGETVSAGPARLKINSCKKSFNQPSHEGNKKKIARRQLSSQLARGKALFLATASLLLCETVPLVATENVPHSPFALWAEVPERGQFSLGLVYEESEAYHIWAGGQIHNITVKDGGESYGIDINQAT